MAARVYTRESWLESDGALRFLTLGALLAVGACSGDGEPAQPTDPTPPPPSLLLAVGPAPLRRLTNAEYLNALHDLFPTQSPDAAAAPARPPVGGFDNAAEAQQPSDVLIARYETIANLYAAGGDRRRRR